MPQIILLAMIGAGVYAGSRWLRGKLDNPGAASRAGSKRRGQRGQPDSSRPHMRNMGDLKPDPETGIYRAEEYRAEE